MMKELNILFLDQCHTPVGVKDQRSTSVVLQEEGKFD